MHGLCESFSDIGSQALAVLHGSLREYSCSCFNSLDCPIQEEADILFINGRRLEMLEDDCYIPRSSLVFSRVFDIRRDNDTLLLGSGLHVRNSNDRCSCYRIFYSVLRVWKFLYLRHMIYITFIIISSSIE